jgi:putative ABC transport system permease protein
MYLRIFLDQFFRDLKAHKLRSGLTVLGIVWGTISIVLLLAFGTGLGAQLRKSFHGLGEGIVILFPGKTALPYEGFNRGRVITLREEDAELIRRQSTLVAQISPEYEKSDVSLSRGEAQIRADVSGVLPEFSDMRNLIADRGGRFLNDLDLSGKRRVVFVGDKLKTDLFKDEPAVGESIVMAGTPFTVVGVLKPKLQDSNYSGNDERKAFIPTSTFAALFSAKNVDFIIYKAKDPRRNAELSRDVYRILGRRHRFDPNDLEALKLWDTTEIERFFLLFITGFNVFIGVVGAFTLVVGGIGVANIMNVVVEERTREIGIKLALGAKKKLIRAQFLLETFLIIGFGGLLGFAISWAVTAVFPRLGVEEFVGTPTISPLVALTAVALLGAVGTVAGYSPARRASELDPVEALRK